jgi:peroxin-19
MKPKLSTVKTKSKGKVALQPTELEKILEQSLDEYEKESLAKRAANVEQSDQENSDAQQQATARRDAENSRLLQQARMEQLMAGMGDTTFGPTLQTTLRSLSQTNAGIENVDDLFSSIKKKFDTGLEPGFAVPTDDNDKEGIEQVDVTVASTLNMLRSAQRGMEGFEANKMEEVGESMMEQMMAQIEELGEKEDYNEVVDGIMRQLLSRDLMYIPLKQICDKFPEWLALHRPKLREAEYNDYGKQYQTFQRLIAVYDTEPDNFPRLMELMYDLQKYGQPPADIIKDLAPGLKFDENGMPIMPNMGAGMVPEMPGGSGLPDLGEHAFNMANGQCCIM